jgi:putative isomerase
VNKQVIILLVSLFAVFGCSKAWKQELEMHYDYLDYSKNILDYRITPKDSLDKSGLMFSDQGAWFAYSLPKTEKNFIGYSGPYLMTQQNGIWSDIIMSRLVLSEGTNNSKIINFMDDLKSQKSYSSHLEQLIENDKLQIKTELVFLNGHTVLQRFSIKNKTDFNLELNTNIHGGTYQGIGIKLSNENNEIKLTSRNSEAVGYIKTLNKIERIDLLDEDRFYDISIQFR